MGWTSRMYENGDTLNRKNYLRGCDVSKHQSALTDEMFNLDFMIIKATEGVTYTDPKFHSHITNALERGLLVGAYHYARPDNNNSPVDEALNFVNAIGTYYKSGMVLALDWESKAWNYSIDWAIEWLEKIREWTGITPVFYASGGLLKSECKKIEERGFGLWVADYSANSIFATRTKPFDDWVIRQYASAPFDLDVLNGNEEMWKKWSTQKVPVVEEVPTPPNVEENENDKPKDCTCCFCSAMRRLGYRLNDETINQIVKSK